MTKADLVEQIPAAGNTITHAKHLGVAHLQSLCFDRTRIPILLSKTTPPHDNRTHRKMAAMALGFAENGGHEEMVNDLGAIAEACGTDDALCYICDALIYGYVKRVERLTRRKRILKEDVVNLCQYVTHGYMPFEEYEEFHEATERLARIVMHRLVDNSSLRDEESNEATESLTDAVKHRPVENLVSKEQRSYVATCIVCEKVMGKYKFIKDIPKLIACPHCGTGQSTQEERQYVSKSTIRNYPEDYFENQ